MKISILDDYFDTLRTLQCFRKLDGHDVTIWNDHVQDTDALAVRLKSTEVLVLIRERTPIRAPLLERLDALRLISQRSVYSLTSTSTRVRASRRHRVIRSACWQSVLCHRRTHVGTDHCCHATDSSADVRASRRRLAGRRRQHPARQDAGIYGYGRIGATVAGYGKAFGMNVLVWGREASRERARNDGYLVAQQASLFRIMRRRLPAHATGT